MAAAGSELCFFLEEDRAEALALVRQLCDGAEDASIAAKGAAVQRLAALLGKYQEQATLLDPLLEQLVGPAMQALRDRLRACEQLRDPALAASQRIQLPAALPLCAYVRQLCRVRGYKQIVHRMPHEVQDLELCLRLLQGQVRCLCQLCQAACLLRLLRVLDRLVEWFVVGLCICNFVAQCRIRRSTSRGKSDMCCFFG